MAKLKIRESSPQHHQHPSFPERTINAPKRPENQPTAPTPAVTAPQTLIKPQSLPRPKLHFPFLSSPLLSTTHSFKLKLPTITVKFAPTMPYLTTLPSLQAPQQKYRSLLSCIISTDDPMTLKPWNFLNPARETTWLMDRNPYPSPNSNPQTQQRGYYVRVN